MGALSTRSCFSTRHLVAEYNDRKRERMVVISYLIRCKLWDACHLKVSVSAPSSGKTGKLVYFVRYHEWTSSWGSLWGPGQWSHSWSVLYPLSFYSSEIKPACTTAQTEKQQPLTARSQLLNINIEKTKWWTSGNLFGLQKTDVSIKECGVYIRAYIKYGVT